jgi:FAD/FMN-containing dehydrogenase
VSARERVLALLPRVLPPERIDAAALAPGRDPLPLVAPASEDELRAVLALARAERWTLLPLGLASKLAWFPAPERVDLAVSSRALAGVTAYEPADGTLTARAGTRWSELAATTRARHHLSPELAGAERATLGGVLGAGASGLDRLRHGPLRHQVLGVDVLLADGTRVKSGGRVVKNVTGYDLHRLWCGSRGSLCFLLEATLRLYPAPEESAVLRAHCASLDDGLARSHALLRAGAQPVAVVLASRGTERAELALVLAGRADALAGEIETCARLTGADETLVGDDARAARAGLREGELEEGEPAPLVVTCRPSRLAKVLAALAGTAGELGAPPRVRCHPLLASLEARFHAEPGPREIEAVARGLAGLECTVRWRGRHARDAEPSGPAAELMRRLRSALDPDGLFVRPSFA